MNRKKTQRFYREEGLSVRKRRGRKKATGTRAPLLTLAVPYARWLVDFVYDQFAHGHRSVPHWGRTDGATMAYSST